MSTKGRPRSKSKGKKTQKRTCPRDAFFYSVFNENSSQFLSFVTFMKDLSEKQLKKIIQVVFQNLKSHTEVRPTSRLISQQKQILENSNKKIFFPKRVKFLYVLLILTRIFF